MRKKSLVSMICVLLLALAATTPVWAAAPTADGGAPRFSLVSEFLSWFLDLLPTPPQDGPEALPAAGNGNGGAGGTTTTTCELCIGDEIKSNIDPNG